MKKCVLVVFIGMVLAINIYGVVDKLVSNVDDCNCKSDSTFILPLYSTDILAVVSVI